MSGEAPVDPRELIKQYDGLGGCLGPLTELVRVNPGLAEEVLALAMVMGIQAAERRKQPAAFRALPQPDWFGFDT